MNAEDLAKAEELAKRAIKFAESGRDCMGLYNGESAAIAHALFAVKKSAEELRNSLAELYGASRGLKPRANWGKIINDAQVRAFNALNATPEFAVRENNGK